MPQKILIIFLVALHVNALIPESAFSFERGKVYEYHFSVDSELVLSAFKNQSVFNHLEGQSYLRLGEKGQLLVSLQKIVLPESNFQRANTACDESRIRTANSQICTPFAEQPWFENLKRALLSHFVMTAKSLEVPSYTTETDVSGECLTEYVPQRLSPTTIKMNKRKYTAGCTKRFGYRSSMELLTTQSPKRSQKIPHVDGLLLCTQIIETGNGMLNSTCNETVLIIGNRENIDNTAVHVQTTMRRMRVLDPVDVGDLRGFSDFEKLEFDFTTYRKQTTRGVSRDKSEFLKLLRDVHVTNSPRSMYRAIRNSNLMSYDEHKAVVNEIETEDNKDIRRVYAGTLVETGTVAAFKVLRENAQLLELSLSDVISALRKVSQPDVSLLKLLGDLLREEAAAVVMPVAGVLQTFCQQNQHCKSIIEVDEILTQIMKMIGTDCTYDDGEQMNQIIIALRALGSVGKLVPKSHMATMLSSCLANSEVDVSVQVAAVEALRQTECNQQFDDILAKYMTDRLRDVELRIFAYRYYMRCPMENKLLRIIGMLQNESSQQFGSYVYSHLTNLVTLVGPISEPWSAIIGPFEKHISQFRRKFVLNRQSFSKHYGSFYRLKNIGINVETSVIFGPESPLPRVVTVNVTIDLFDGQLSLLDFEIRSTEQSQIWKNLLKPTVAPVPVLLDALEKAIRRYKRMEKMTTAFVRLGAQDQWYIRDVKKFIHDWITSSKTPRSGPIQSKFLVSNRVLIDSSLFVPTSAGLPMEIKYLVLTAWRKSSQNQMTFVPGEVRVNWTSSLCLSLGTQLEIFGFQHRSTTNQWWSLSLDGNVHGLFHYAGQRDKKVGQMYLQNWGNDQLAFNYKYDNYAILDDSVISSSINSPQITLISQTPAYVDTLLGIRATSKVVLADNSSDIWPTEAALCVNKFRGLDVKFELEHGGDWIGSVKRCYLFFSRPGELDLSEGPKPHLELSFETGSVNKTAQFVQFRLIPPWQHELSVRAEYGQNGILQASGNLSSTPWQVYGVYTDSQDQQRFTARIHYLKEILTLAFRGNVTGNFKLQIHSSNSSWPKPLEMTQRAITSRHTYYPSFKRFHHDTWLRLPGDQVLNLQLEWNTGRRNGRLEQGVIRLKHSSGQDSSELQSALTWTEGDAVSQLDRTVDGYSRKLTVETKAVQSNNKPLLFTFGMDQFSSKNIWMIHTDLPAIVSFSTWSHSPDLPSIHLNYSIACIFRYRLDQGGSVETFSYLTIPTQNIDAMARGYLKWKSIRKAGVSWIQDLSGSVTFRIFPPENDRYFRVNISHTVTQNVVTVSSVEFDSKTLYMVESTLYRGLPVHSFRFRWPTDQEIVMNTTYTLQVGPKTMIAFRNLLARNENEPIAAINTEIFCHLETNKLLIRHNSTKFVEGGTPQLIAGFEWGNELHGSVASKPLQIDFKAAGLLQIQIPILEIDSRMDALVGTYFGPQKATLQGRLLYSRPMSNSKYGVDFMCKLITQSGVTVQANLDFYLSGHPTRSSGCDFKFTSADSARTIALECSKDSFGSILFHEKFRRKYKLEMEGSTMLAVIPNNPTRHFKGWYSNYNYAVSKFPLGMMLEIRGEFTPNSGVGPGSPIRLYLQFTGDKSYRSGNLEAVFNSQHIGFWTGFEMGTIMLRYELTGWDAKNEEIKLTARAIMGFRHLEGRGTRAFESGFQVSLSQDSDKFHIQLQAGQPGRSQDNSVSFRYCLESTQTFASLDIWLFSLMEFSAKSEVSYDQSGRFGEAKLELIVPRLNAANSMLFKRDGEFVKLLIVSNNETYLDVPVLLSEDVPVNMDNDPVQFSFIYPGISVPGSPKKTVRFSQLGWKARNHNSFRALNTSLDIGPKGDKHKYSVFLSITSGRDRPYFNQIDLKTTYPWPIEASFLFGRKTKESHFYRHNIRKLGKDDRSSWTSQADCYIDAAYATSCGMNYRSQIRTANVSFKGQPEQNVYQTELSWDRTRAGMIQIFLKGLNSVSLRTPLRHIDFQLESSERKLGNESVHAMTNYTVASWDPELEKPAREAYATLLVYQLKDKTEDKRNWTYGAKLLSNLLSKDSVECNLTVDSASDHLGFRANLFTEDQLNHKLRLQLILDDSKKDTIHSQFDLKIQDSEYSVLGKHVLKSSYMTSEITLSHPVVWMSSGRWNVTIDSWNQLSFTNFNETNISGRMWRNNTHNVMEQILMVNNGLLNMTHFSSLQLSPFQLDSILNSISGRAWITGRKNGPREFLVEAEHSTSNTDWSILNRRKDLVARFLFDPENTVHVNLNWRPGLINEILLHGTELSDVERIKILLQNPVPMASNIHKLLTVLSGENDAPVINHQKLKEWWHTSVKDVHQAFFTIQRFWNQDQFYLKTLNIPVVEQLGQLNVTELAENITSVQAVLLAEVGQILKTAAEEDLVSYDQLELLKLDIERNRFPLFKPTFEAMIRMTNAIMWATGQFANFLFGKVAACANAVYTLQQSLRTWYDNHYARISTLGQTPFAVQLGKFLSQLQTQIPALKPVGCFYNTMMKSVSALVSQSIQYCQRLVLGTLPEKELLDLLSLMATGQVENASQLFFKPHLTKLTADLEKGMVKLSVHIPRLFEKLIDSAIGTQSFPRQIFSWIYPSRGMKSLMYAYDQYQHNFEAMRKLTHLIPPYRVTAWLMMDLENNGYVVTFNGLFIPIRKSHRQSYLLVANNDDGRKLLIVHEFVYAAKQGGWRTKLTIGSATVQITDEGHVNEIQDGNEEPVCLPYIRSLDSLTRLRVTRNGDRILLRVHRTKIAHELISILFDLRLRYLRVHLDGAWHGQCRGLLGTNDFEQLHELLDPEARRIWNQSEVARLWSYNPSDGNKMDNLQVVNKKQSFISSNSHSLCNDKWQRFQSCFADVNPEPWIKACAYHRSSLYSPEELDTGDHQNQWDERFCFIARVYVHSCNRHDVPLRVPHQCISCSPGDGLKLTDLTMKQEAVRASGKRITVVVEMGSCFERRKNEIIELVILLDKSKQTQPTQYSAILFTSLSGVTETTRLTSKQGAVWMSGEQFLQTLRAFDGHAKVTSKESYTTDFVEWPRATEALSRAIRQPAASAEFHDSVLLFICSGCTPEGSQYKTVTRVIKRKGIDFHYIPDTSFTTVGDLNRNVFLLTSEGNYDELLPEGSVRRVVNIGTVNAPRDHCSLIAQGSGGLIWAYQNVATTKQRLRVVITSIASHLTQQVAVRRHCVCRDNLYGAGVLDCSVSTNKTMTKLEHFPSN